ncbi:MAG: TrmB family transcriptional regulator [Promethearchaeota archaeon]
MGQVALRNALRSFGVTEKETEVYILLAKKGIHKTGYIAKQLRTNSGLVYRILKSLQKKGLVEATLEYPTRYTAVPLEKVIDVFIKSKRDEVAQIEKAKKDLLSDWKKISQSELESSIEKLAIIEGNKKIHNKMSHMIKETKNQFSMALTVSDLFRAEQSGVFDFANKHPMKSKIHFRIITPLSKQNLKAAKLLKTKLKPEIHFKGTNPSLGSPRFSRMAIQDDDEIILFMSDKESLKDGREVCLCTNCQSIIDAFSVVFEDFWKDSADFEDRISEIETGKMPPRTQVIKDPVAARNLYYKVLDSAKEEILIVTSSNGLIGLLDEKSSLREWSDNDVDIRIMAPIIGENLNAAQQLLEFGEVRHVPLGYLETTIIDGCHLFQFKYPLEGEKSVQTRFFSNAYYTNDFNYVEKTKKMLFDIWRKTRIPSVMTLEPTARGLESAIYPVSKMETRNVVRRISVFRSLKDEIGTTTRMEVLDKFNNAKKYPIDHYSEKALPRIVRFFGNGAFALILPPRDFGLPKLIIAAFKHNDKSSFGEEDVMYIYLLTDEKDSYHSENVAVIQTNPKAIGFRRAEHANTLSANNIRLLREDQFQIRKGGNTLFVGWTVPITLIPLEYVLPPSCILFEGYGKINSGTVSTIFPSGRKNEVVYNCLEAFVTFYHPSSKYSGSGTEGFIETELVRTSHS